MQYKSITWPNVNQSNCVYEFSLNDTSNQHETTQDTITYAPNIVSKAMLVRLAVQSVKQNVEEITELSHINPNGTVKSIQEWSRIAVRGRTTHIIDETQQRAFEVIMSAFLMMFYDEAKQNVKTNGTVIPHSRHHYVKLRSDLRKLSGRPNGDHQLIMFLTGAGGSGKTEIIDSVLAYAKGFCLQMQYVFDK